MIDKRFTDVFNQYPKSRRGNFKTHLNQWEKLTEEEKERASEVATEFIESKSEANYKYLCNIGRYITEKRWEDIVDTKNPATFFTPEQIEGYEEIGMIYFPAEEGPGRFDFPVEDKTPDYDIFM